MQKVIADFVARATFHMKSAGKRMEDFEKSRIILSDKYLLVASNKQKISVKIPDIFDVKKIDVPDDIRDMVEDSIKIAFFKNKQPGVIVIKGDNQKIGKFSYLLMKLLLKGNQVIYKHPAVKGGVLTSKNWEDGLLNVMRGSIVLNGFQISLSSIRDIKRESRTIGKNQVDVLNISAINSGESYISYVHVPDKRIMNLLGRYIGFEYKNILKALEKVELSNFDKQIVQAVYSGIPVEELPLVMNLEAAEVQRIVVNLEKRNLIKNGKLTPFGEVAVSRYVEDINV